MQQGFTWSSSIRGHLSLTASLDRQQLPQSKTIPPPRHFRIWRPSSRQLPNPSQLQPQSQLWRSLLVGGWGALVPFLMTCTGRPSHYQQTRPFHLQQVGRSLQHTFHPPWQIYQSGPWYNRWKCRNFLAKFRPEFEFETIWNGWKRSDFLFSK